MPPPQAAFANSTILHSRCQEDDYHQGVTHIGVVAIPAVMALGEVKRKNGRDVITAVAAGYEVGARLSKDFVHLSVARGFRGTPLYCGIGAAAAASKILDLTEEQTVNALGWAANFAGGLIQSAVAGTLELEMPLQAGFAARDGVISALLAEAGADVAKDTLEGERGFYHAFTGSTQGLEQIFDGLGQQYEMLDVFFKRHPVPGISQTEVSAMIAAAREYNIDAGDVQQITVGMCPWEAAFPGAKTIVQLHVAQACVHKRLTMKDIIQVDDPEVNRLIPKINVVPDESLGPLSCRLSITLNDGRILNKDMLLSYKDYCFSLDEDTELITSLIPEMTLPKENAIKVIEMIRNLEDCEDIGEIMAVCQAPIKRKVVPLRLRW